jgi:hypothetical protein
MKRIIAAVSFALLAAPAFAADVGKPFEQLDIDRALPNVPERASSEIVYPFGGSAPFEQLAIDRALPNIPENSAMFASVGGSTRSDSEIATQEGGGSPWANDHNFIAPPQ